jgi:antitoxin VapB
VALSIKDPEVDQMARRLARERQTTMTGAIKLALGNELNRGGVSPEERAKRRQSIRDIQAGILKEKIDWTLSDDEILGYGEDGLPI